MFIDFRTRLTANALVDYLRDENWEVWGTTRNALTVDLLRKKYKRTIVVR